MGQEKYGWRKGAIVERYRGDMRFGKGKYADECKRAARPSED